VIVLQGLYRKLFVPNFLKPDNQIELKILFCSSISLDFADHRKSIKTLALVRLVGLLALAFPERHQTHRRSMNLGQN
jgi:hypothetical protein